jgi:hypothetical protein
MTGRRWGLPLLLLASLLVNGAMRLVVRGENHRLCPPSLSGANLSAMNSFSLGLFLGGLRGPLVMFLWSSSETQKSEKDLEGFDTKIEMIRLLQPRFDSVHIFQMWNKAYNISVQMASKANKYTTILSAIDYGRNVDAERPDNLNILAAIGGLYTDKLGESAEKRYYIDRFRAESLPVAKMTFPSARADELLKHAAAAGVSLTAEDIRPAGDRRSSVSIRMTDEQVLRPLFDGPDVAREYKPRAARPGPRMTHDQLLDENGHLLVARPYLKRYDRPDGVSPSAGPFGFPQGLPPHAVGYDYHKRVQLLRRTTGQRHLQLGDRVLETRPSAALKQWAEEEFDRGRRLEIRLFERPIPPGRIAMELPSAALTKPAVPGWIPLAVFCYERSAQLFDDGVREHDQVLLDVVGGFDPNPSQRDGMVAQRDLVRADALYLSALSSAGEARASLLRQASRSYQWAIDGYYRIMLRYYVEDDVVAVVYPQFEKDGQVRRHDKTTIGSADPAMYPKLYEAVAKFIYAPRSMGGKGGLDMHREDRQEYETYIRRALDRQGIIGRLTAGPATTRGT